MQPLTLIPWHNDFIPALGEHLVTREDFSRITILFPHNRPRRYLKNYFRVCDDLPKPIFLPQMTSIAEFISGIRRNLTDTHVPMANQLDLVELLRIIIADLQQEGGGLLGRLPELDREAFLPWGLRLAKLLDDLLRQNIEPTDLSYMEGEVSQYASALLEQLSRIHHEYVSRLFERGWTTPGLDWRFVVHNINDVVAHLGDTPIVAAGFYALSGAENLFFRRLWEEGRLHPVIHTDPALASGQPGHWAAAEHVEWLKRWHTRAVIPPTQRTSPTKPDIRFCEGFDRHSQLAAMADDMAGSNEFDNTAVILPDEGALLPVLHHLPETEPNISMGYPLDRTSLARLIETLITLQENRLDDGRYYWKDVINLIRHPYLRLLGPKNKPLRKIFHIWEAEIRTGDRYINPMAWKPPYGDEVLDGVAEKLAEPLRQKVLKNCLTIFEAATTLNELSHGLNKLAELLHAEGDHLWHTYLVDAECLFRLTTSVIPQLKSAEISGEDFSQSTLFSILKRILSQERVSFEPEPLAGLQVLGVLETRLLHFRKLFILDAVEERLPGTDPFDPLMPDPLRKLLLLPDTRQRDNVSGYNFYRLLMGADEAVIYYQSGVQPGLLDSKSVRSRFVEQLLWEREQEEERIIKTGDPLVRAVTFPAGALHNTPESIPVTSAIRNKLAQTLQEQGLSASRLDQYMNCPKQFFYSYLSKVRPLDSVDEDGDRSAFGSLVHEVLQEYFKPFIGKKIDLASEDITPLLALYDERLRESADFAKLPLDTRMALSKTGRHRLSAFHATQRPCTLLGLEKRLDATVTVDELTIPLRAFLDRIEERDEGVYILDYKTGGGVTPKQAFWEDMDIWQRIHDSQEEADPLLLPDLADAVKSVQLPLYAHMYSECEQVAPYESGLIKLGEDGKTALLFGKKWTEDQRKDAVDVMTPKLIKNLIRHMIHAIEFTPQPGQRCQWCDFSGPCGQ